MSSPIVSTTFYVRDSDTSAFTCVVQDEAGTPIPGSALDSLSCWLYLRDGSTNPIINGRNGQDVLNANGGSLDESGNFELILGPADNEFQGTTGGTEIHVLLLRWEYATDQAGSFDCLIQVTDQPKVSVP